MNVASKPPLDMYRFISFLPTRYPTTQDDENDTWIELTSTVEWNTTSNKFPDEEKGYNKKEIIDDDHMNDEIKKY